MSFYGLSSEIYFRDVILHNRKNAIINNHLLWTFTELFLGRNVFIQIRYYAVLARGLEFWTSVYNDGVSRKVSINYCCKTACFISQFLIAISMNLKVDNGLGLSCTNAISTIIVRWQGGLESAISISILHKRSEKKSREKIVCELIHKGI